MTESILLPSLCHSGEAHPKSHSYCYVQSEQYLNPETEARGFIGAGVIEEEEE